MCRFLMPSLLPSIALALVLSVLDSGTSAADLVAGGWLTPPHNPPRPPPPDPARRAASPAPRGRARGAPGAAATPAAPPRQPGTGASGAAADQRQGPVLIGPSGGLRRSEPRRSAPSKEDSAIPSVGPVPVTPVAVVPPPRAARFTPVM